MSSPLRIVMLGTGDFALPTFEHLLDSEHEVVGLVTQPDRPQGRKQEILLSPIKKQALSRGVRVEQPENINAPVGLDLIREFRADLLVTAAYGQILSGELLGLPRLGGINLHGSILPKYRGAAPVARAIQNGETESGVTVIRMSPRVDAGGMIAFARTPIDPDETAGKLEDRLARLGAPLVVRTIGDLVSGRAEILPQSASEATKAPKLKKDDGIIDWTALASTIHNLVRAMNPWPMASTTWDRGDAVAPLRLIVHKTAIEAGASGEPGLVVEADGDRFVVAAGRDAVRLLVVQPEGKKPMPAEEFLRGRKPFGSTLRFRS